jgi:hypothetical protein
VDIESSWHEGRFMTNSTLWWFKREPLLIDKLYCVHNRALNLRCGKCEAGIEWEDSSSSV